MQREKILPSEKAFAYKMKLEAMKRQAGRPSRINSSPVTTNLKGQRSDEILGKQVGESKDTIRHYIRLTELIPSLLDMVDENKVAMRPAVELSYLPKEQFRMPKERVSKYFSPGTPVKQMEDTIVKALELYRKRERNKEKEQER